MAAVHHEPREMLEARTGGLDRCAVELRTAQDLPGHPHGFLFYKWKLVPLGNDLAPFVDLLVNVDLHRANAGAAPVERRGKWQRAVLAKVERRVDDDADRSRIGRAVAQAPAAPV